MKVDVLLGLQWGDEGKGKVVDVLTPNYDVITRFQGGPNAGHTLEFNGEKYVLRSIPSGIFQGGKVNVIGNGVVLDPLLFQQEAEALAASGHDLTKQLCISKKAHLIFPTHRIFDAVLTSIFGYVVRTDVDDNSFWFKVNHIFLEAEQELRTGLTADATT